MKTRDWIYSLVAGLVLCLSSLSYSVYISGWLFSNLSLLSCSFVLISFWALLFFLIPSSTEIEKTDVRGSNFAYFYFAIGSVCGLFSMLIFLSMTYLESSGISKLGWDALLHHFGSLPWFHQVGGFKESAITQFPTSMAKNVPLTWIYSFLVTGSDRYILFAQSLHHLLFGFSIFALAATAVGSIPIALIAGLFSLGAHSAYSQAGTGLLDSIGTSWIAAVVFLTHHLKNSKFAPGSSKFLRFFFLSLAAGYLPLIKGSLLVFVAVFSPLFVWVIWHKSESNKEALKTLLYCGLILLLTSGSYYIYIWIRWGSPVYPGYPPVLVDKFFQVIGIPLSPGRISAADLIETASPSLNIANLTEFEKVKIIWGNLRLFFGSRTEYIVKPGSLLQQFLTPGLVIVVPFWLLARKKYFEFFIVMELACAFWLTPYPLSVRYAMTVGVAFTGVLFCFFLWLIFEPSKYLMENSLYSKLEIAVASLLALLCIFQAPRWIVAATQLRTYISQRPALESGLESIDSLNKNLRFEYTRLNPRQVICQSGMEKSENPNWSLHFGPKWANEVKYFFPDKRSSNCDIFIGDYSNPNHWYSSEIKANYQILFTDDGLGIAKRKPAE